MILSGILTTGDTEISLLSDVRGKGTHTDLDFEKLYVYCGNSIRLQKTQQSKGLWLTEAKITGAWTLFPASLSFQPSVFICPF